MSSQITKTAFTAAREGMSQQVKVDYTFNKRPNILGVILAVLLCAIKKAIELTFCLKRT